MPSFQKASVWRLNAKKRNIVLQTRCGAPTRLMPTPMEGRVVENQEEQDKSKRFEIVGIEDADKIRKDFWNTINCLFPKNVEWINTISLRLVECY